MKTLDKKAIQVIAEKHEVKSSILAQFVARVSTLDKDAAEAELAKYKVQSGITKPQFRAAQEAFSEMFGGEPSKKDKKDKKKDKSEEKGGKEDKKDKKESSGDSFKAKYIYPKGLSDAEKKAFRVKARSEAKKWDKAKAEAPDGKLPKKEREKYEAWVKETYAAE